MSLKLLSDLFRHEARAGCWPPSPLPKPPLPIPVPPRPPEFLETAAAPSQTTRAMLSIAHDAIRLHQLGESLGGPVQTLLTEGANMLFDEHCGSVPLSELIRGLHHWPPPPPSVWTSHVENLVAMYSVEAAISGGPDLSKPVGHAKTLLEQILGGLVFIITGGGGAGSGGPGTHVVTIKPIPIPGPVPHFPVDLVRKLLDERGVEQAAGIR